jgi:hypothetical protein
MEKNGITYAGERPTDYITLRRTAELLEADERHVLFAMIQPGASQLLRYAEVSNGGACILVPRSEFERVKKFLSKPHVKKMIQRSEETSERESRKTQGAA